MSSIRWTLFLIYSVIAPLMLASCLTTPETPDTTPSIPTISILMIQDGHDDSTNLKVAPNSAFSLKAKVSHSSDSNQLDFVWMRDSKILGTGRIIDIDSNGTIPNTLKVTDKEDNFLMLAFEVIFNTPPQMEETTTPSEGDTLYGNFFTTFFFSWASTDSDEGETCSHFLQIDSTIYSTSDLQQVQQAGLSEGIHRFRVWVVDSFGDADTLNWRSFTVIDTTGENE